MGLKLTKKTKIEIEVPYSEADAEKVKLLISTIVNNTNINELTIISKVSNNTEIKNMALNAAKSLL